MVICYVADARSPIARNWISHFVSLKHEVHIISSYPCASDTLPGAQVHVVPIAFSPLSRVNHSGAVKGKPERNLWNRILSECRAGRVAKFADLCRYWLAPTDVFPHVDEVRTVIRRINPDLVHAMRIPFEGILAAWAVGDRPLLMSVWGNDFTLFASRYTAIGWLTRMALEHADGLHCDCERDLNLSRSWGYGEDRPSWVMPGGGGINGKVFFPGEPDERIARELNIPTGSHVVINARGFRSYVRNDTFFSAIPTVLANRRDVCFLAVGMKDNPVAENWVKSLGVGENVRLLPTMPQSELAAMFRLSEVSASITEHDGTPNTLIEALACGCFPVAGNIESVREWLKDGENGFLVDPGNPQQAGAAILKAIEDKPLRERAFQANRQMIAHRAEHSSVMAAAERMYAQLVGGAS